MKILLSRFGGIGDAVILTPVAKELTKRGNEVHISVPMSQVKLFDNLPECFAEVHGATRFHGHLDCVKGRWGYASLESIKDEYNILMGEEEREFTPIDYKYSIELNAHPDYQGRADYMGYWLRSQNSNFQNWIDLSLGWAGIDPTSVKPEDKIPSYREESFEKNWVGRLLRNVSRPLIGLHMYASSLSRTYYRHEDVARQLIEHWPSATILHWTGNNWILGTRAGAKLVELPASKDPAKQDEHPSPMRHTVSLINRMDLVICADSAISHYAASVNVPCITTYTTVPPWTRNKYYPKSIGIKGDVQCHPCFNLGKYCPLNQIRAEDTLSDREKKMFRLERGGLIPQKAAEEMETHVEGLNHEYNAARQRMEGIAGMIPDCVKSITPEQIVEAAKGVFDA